MSHTPPNGQYLQVTLKVGEKYNHCFRKQTQAQKEILKTANLVVANTVTNKTVNNTVINVLDP